MVKQTSRLEQANKKFNSRKARIIDKVFVLPEEVQSPRELHVVLDRRAIETARKATDEFLIARRINVDTDSISVADPIAMLILSMDEKISGSDAAYKAAGFYKMWQEDARREGLMVGMTMHSVIDREPLPYLEEEEEEEIPNWLEDELKIPEPERNLTNRYEYRLKQIYDVLDEAGAMFSAQFKHFLDNDMADQLRKLGIGLGGTDEDGFHKKASDKPVPPSSRAKGANQGDRPSDE